MKYKKKLLASFAGMGGALFTTVAITGAINPPTVQQQTMKTVVNNTKDTDTAFYAHRGFDSKFPEETRSAFQGAINQGFNGAEFDVWMTKDGVPVINHDATIDRTVRGGHKGNVNSYTFAELEKFDFSKGYDNVGPQKMLSLAQFTKEFSTHFKYVNMEIKQHMDNVEVSSWNVVKSYVQAATNQWMIQSFEQNVIKAWYNLKTGTRLGLLANVFLGLKKSGIFNYITDFNPMLLTLQATPHWFAQVVKEHNLRVSVWTINSKLQWNILNTLEKVFNFHANYITDYPIFKGDFK